jgi:DNA-binding transcriptional MerR regulator
MMPGMPTQYSLADLCDLADVTPRTVRYYIAQGLLRSPSGAGPSSRYDDGHLNRLRLIRRLQREHLPLSEIRNRLAAVSDEEAEAIAREPAPVVDSASDYIARVLASRGMPNRPTPPPSVQVAALRAPPAPAARSTAPAEEAPPARSQWERIALDPDIEVHIRRPLSRDRNRLVDRLLQAARAILKEEPE